MSSGIFKFVQINMKHLLYFSDHRSTFAETFEIPKMSVRIGSVSPIFLANIASYASQVSPTITHNQGVHDLDIFISGCIFYPQRSLSSLKLCYPFSHCAKRMILFPKGFNEIFMNFIGLEGNPFLQKYLITALILSFSILQSVAPSFIKVLYISKQA